MKRTLILAGFVAALGLGTATLMAGRGGGGGGGGFGGGGGAGGGGAGGGGPGGGGGGGFGRGNLVNQYDTYRQDMAVVDDGEWGAISNRIAAVTAARTLANPNMNNRGGGPGGGRRGVAAGAATTTTTDSDAMAALQKDYDDKAPTPAIKADIVKVLKEHNDNQAAYLKAQDDLRLLLTARQEAYLTLKGVLR